MERILSLLKYLLGGAPAVVDECAWDAKIHFLQDSLARNLSWVAAADNKVPPIFAIDMAMIGSMCALTPKVSQWDFLTATVFGIALLLLIFSLFALSLVAFPRLDGPAGSVIFFGGITQHSEGQFIAKMNNVPAQEIIDDLARQIYRNAEIARDKYLHVRWAMMAMFFSSPFWSLAVGLLYASQQ